MNKSEDYYLIKYEFENNRDQYGNRFNRKSNI